MILVVIEGEQTALDGHLLSFTKYSAKRLFGIRRSLPLNLTERDVEETSTYPIEVLRYVRCPSIAHSWTLPTSVGLCYTMRVMSRDYVVY